MAIASADATVHRASVRSLCSRARRANSQKDMPANSASSEYERASCEYQMSRGLNAASAAITTATRREASSLPAAYATGTNSVPASADSDRNPTSPCPKTRDQIHASA